MTINVGADLPDSSIPPTVMLDFVGYRIGDASIGSPGRDAVYLHVYDGFGINGDGTVDGGAIGSLVAVSTNTLNLEPPLPPSTDLIWFFDQPSLAKDVTYHYILANNDVAATSADFSNLIYSDLIVASGDPHAGGDYYPQDGDTTPRDLFFRVQSSFSAIPEPSTLALAAVGLLGLGSIGRRRRKRA